MNSKTAENDKRAMQLLQSYRNGDSNAFSLLYDMYINMLLNYGRCLTNDTALVEDCVQDVFVRLLDNSQPLRISKVSSYLLIALRNRVMDRFRHASFTSDKEVENLAGLTDGSDIEASVIDDEAQSNDIRLLNNLLNRLTPRQRQAFQLYYIEGKEYTEVCQQMNMSYHSIRNLVHRGMVRMRSAAVMLGRYTNTDSDKSFLQ